MPVAIVALLVGTAACSTDDGRTLRPPRPDQNDSVATTTLPPTSDPSFVDNSDPSAFVVTGPWADGSRIAAKYTCEAGDVSPPVAFGNVPAGTVGLGIALYPTDSPDRILWAIANIDAASPFVPEGQVPAGAAVAAATDGTLGYSGPCPPDTAGSFTLVAFALGQVVDVLEGDPADEALAVMQLAAIDIDTTTFTYGP